MTTSTDRPSSSVGFAPAAEPRPDQAIRTAADGLCAGMVEIAVAGAAMPAYRARPEGGRALPVVLVIQEIFGLHDYIRDVVRRLAHQGYYAIAPALFVRQGDPMAYQDIGRLMSDVVAKVSDRQLVDDLSAVTDFIAGEGRGDVARLAVTGFCWGGRATWLYAAHDPRVRCAVAWYGQLAAPRWAPQAASVLGLASSVSVPVLALFGGLDAHIPLSDVAALSSALAGTPSEVRVYEGAEHGFHADYRPCYQAAAAQDGWARMLTWFGRHGVT